MNNVLYNRHLQCTLEDAFKYFPVVTIIGPRQAGKTTLCRKLYNNLPYVNLEDQSVLLQIQADPKAFFAQYHTGVIIDEVQRYPEMLTYLQYIVDEDRIHERTDRHFILTGSANLQLLRHVSESMAGRTAVLTLLPLSGTEIQMSHTLPDTNTCILRGGYPAIWCADDGGRSLLFSSYYTTYVERDLHQLIAIKDSQLFFRFIRLCAGRIGSECNASSLAVEVGVSVPTIQSWLSVLEASYIMFRLQPYYANIGKRLTKNSKIYFYDTGLASWLLGIQSEEHLETHPLRGALFENMVIVDFMKHYLNQAKQPNLYFYRDQRQHEVDLLRENPDGSIWAFEIKSGQTYRDDYFDGLRYLKRSLGDRLTRMTVLYAGENSTPDAEYSIYNYTQYLNAMTD